jgi:hypothetical protein
MRNAFGDSFSPLFTQNKSYSGMNQLLSDELNDAGLGTILRFSSADFT